MTTTTPARTPRADAPSEAGRRDRDHRRRATDGASFAHLLKDLRDEGVLLMREEVALARAETSETIARTTRNAGYLAAGALVAYAGLLFLLGAASVGLSIALTAGDVLPETAAWLSPLIIGGVVAVIGFIFISKAIATLKRESLVPRETVASLKETKTWMRDKIA